MAALTGFLPAQSTVAQRTWVVLWLVSGQTFFIFIVMVMEIGKTMGFFGGEAGWVHVCVIVFSSIPLCTAVTSVIGGLVVVAQMIEQDRVCIRV